MSQNEMEPQPEEEIHQPRYPYAWPGANQPGGNPRDEPPMTYEASSGQREGQGAQAPWWARPQPQQHGTRTLVVAAIISLLLMLLLGAMGVVGLIIGIAGQLLGVIVGGATALFVFVIVLLFMVVNLIISAVRRNAGPAGRHHSRT